MFTRIVTVLVVMMRWRRTNQKELQFRSSLLKNADAMIELRRRQTVDGPTTEAFGTTDSSIERAWYSDGD